MGSQDRLNDPANESADPPLVSIGMAIRNEAPHLTEALDALLAQDHSNFELIISDNNSDDGTEEICRHYLARDSRVRYYRNSTNAGAAVNFNRAFSLASGSFFMWASGHDLWSPTFLSQCLEVLLQDPTVVLCYPQVGLIAGDGTSPGVLEDHLDTRGLRVRARFGMVIEPRYLTAIYGVIRSDELGRTRLFRKVVSPDRVLLAELAFQGYFAQVEQVLFHRRERGGEDHGVLLRRCKDIYPKRGIWLPLPQMVLALGSAIATARVNSLLKARLFADVLRVSAKRLMWSLISRPAEGLSLLLLRTDPDTE